MSTNARLAPVRGGTGDAIDDGSIRVDTRRYRDPAYARAENDLLWKKVWQVACRAERIANFGDFHEYAIAGSSVFVVRDSETTVKAYINACPHRATQLAVGQGSFGSGQIVCPYHGWRWNLDGSRPTVYAERGFPNGCLQASDKELHAIKADMRWGWVWINFDPDAPPLETALGRLVDEPVDSLRLEEARLVWHRYVELPSDWKFAVEGFLEAYHVTQTHPALAFYRDYNPDSRMYEIDPYWGHGWTDRSEGVGTGGSAVEGVGMGEFLVAMNRMLAEGLQSHLTDAQLALQDDILASGVSLDDFPAEFFRRVEDEARTRGVEPPPRAAQHIFMFPNITFLSAFGNTLVYQGRPHPDDPTRCILDIYSMSLAPKDAEPTVPPREGPVALEDCPWVMQQDFENISRQRAGVRSPEVSHVVFSPIYETLNLNLHRVLDRYVGTPED